MSLCSKFFSYCNLENRFLFNPLVAELFCHKLDLLEIVGFLCTFLQHAVC